MDLSISQLGSRIGKYSGLGLEPTLYEAFQATYGRIIHFQDFVMVRPEDEDRFSKLLSGPVMVTVTKAEPLVGPYWQVGETTRQNYSEMANLAKKIVSYVVSEFFDQIIEKSGVESPNYEGLFDSDPLYELLIKVEQSEEDLVIFNI